MKLLWCIAAGLFLSPGLTAQLPVQLFAGHRGVEYQFLWSKDVDRNQKISLFNFTFFMVDYQDSERNASEIYQVATYNLNKNWGLATGGRFTGGIFLPQLALSYQITLEDFYFNLFPSVQYSFSGKQLSYSLFGLFFYQPPLNDRWKIFSQLTFESIVSAQGHAFSFQQIRLGLEEPHGFQFGLGANLEQLGKGFTWTHNFGVFIRKEFP